MKEESKRNIFLQEDQKYFNYLMDQANSFYQKSPEIDYDSFDPDLKIELFDTGLLENQNQIINQEGEAQKHPKKNDSEKKTEKNKKNQRKDQNGIKKIHYKMLKVLNLLEVKQIKKYSKKVFRKDFTVICLMAAQASNKLEQFEANYKKSLEKDLQENGEDQTFLELVELSFEAIQLYKKKGYEQACKCLFSEKHQSSKNLEKAINSLKEIETSLQEVTNQNLP